MQPQKLFPAFAALLLIFITGCEDRPSPDNITGPAQGAVESGTSATGAPDLQKGDDARSTIFTLSNATTGNSVLQFERTSNGSFVPAGSIPTEGTGTGAGLGSQGSLVLEHDLLFAVNAGSNDISVISLREGNHSVISRVPSGGTMPISLTVHGDLLYVLNAGGDGNITGFRGAGSGHLTMLSGSTRPLSGNAVQPAEVAFSPDGRVLLVTEKATNQIDTYTISGGGIANGPQVSPSTGSTPFGFAFSERGDAIVSDASDGAMTSYSARGGSLSLINGPVPDHQAAPCWVVVTDNARFAYTTNAHSNNISGYTVSHSGAIALFNDGGVTAVTGAAPTDMALSREGHLLFDLNSMGVSISAFRINSSNGSLTPAGSVSGLPSGAIGLATR